MTWLSFGARTFHPGSLRVDLRRVADVQATALRLPFRSGSFDGVECYHVLEHLTVWDAAPALRELVRVAAPGAPIEIAVPDMVKIGRLLAAGNTDALIVTYSPAREPEQTHRFGYTAFTLARAMGRCMQRIDFLPPTGLDPNELRLVGYAPTEIMQ